ncbi:MAG: hypothetical protein K8L99_03920 [Anaerolineae bacterium]|nr:hypothetical protein [Anaerolineae bacterium]
MLTNLLNRRILKFWAPGFIAGGIAWIAFLTLGETSAIRASGLALVIVGMALALRRYGAVLSVIGGLALAFSPAFWSQTGGTDSLNALMTVVVLVAAGLAGLVFIRFSERLYLGLLAGFVIFAVLFWSQLAQVGSLRINTLSTAWLLLLLVDGLYITNPRPDEPAAQSLRPYHTVGILVLFAVGVVNDPLFTLLAPAVILTLLLSKNRVPRLYWLILGGFIALGLYGIVDEYVRSTWWTYSAAQAEALNIRVPFVMADGWREASRWLRLVNLVNQQFTVFGMLLGVLGLARLSRWYPPLGTVSMIAYATYALFGLVYFGNNSAVLLLPLLMIQVLWMTYAVHALRDWLRHSVSPGHQAVGWFAPAVYVLLPLVLLGQIAGSL